MSPAMPPCPRGRDLLLAAPYVLLSAGNNLCALFFKALDAVFQRQYVQAMAMLLLECEQPCLFP